MKLHNGSYLFSAILVLEASIGLAGCAPRPPAAPALPPSPSPPGQTAYAEPPPAPPPPPPRQGGPTQPPPANATSTVSGTIRSLNYGPGGLDGLILDQGTIVHFPPEYGNQVNAVAPVGALVVATGSSHSGPAGDTLFDATSITNRRTNATITVLAGPAPPGPPPAPVVPPPTPSLAAPVVQGSSGAPAVASARTTVTETLRSFNYGPDGQVNGLILSSGTVVYFPPEYSAQVTRTAPVGSRVRATGSLRPGPAGNQLMDAETITNRQSGTSVAIANQPAPPPQP